MKQYIEELLKNVCMQCMEQGLLRQESLPAFVVEAPRNKEHGDLATNLAMMLAKTERRPPRQIAQMLVDRLHGASPHVEKIEIAGAGFINFFLKHEAWHDVLHDIATAGDRFGSSQEGGGRRIIVEFVSANPTGPLHIGHGRGAALGDALARILSFVGYDVVREYYINDVGNQMQNLGKSLYLRYLQELGQQVDFPEGLYRGEYMVAIARDLVQQKGRGIMELPEHDAMRFCTTYAAEVILADIKHDLELFGVRFDTWFSERTLFDNGHVQELLAHFQETGLVYETEGALWFRTTQFGDEKDRVVVKEDGTTTYFASDIAYHKQKFDRGFVQAIDIWGADHHGYVPRLTAVLKALGYPENALHVILVQMVNLLRDGIPVAMSTRSGEFVTLRQVIEEVGTDAARFMFLTRRSDAQLDFDLEIAKKQNDENPVYYVQYAHARICSIIGYAAEKGIAPPSASTVSIDLLTEPEERDIIRKLAAFPEVVAGSARACEPHRISVYLMELVGQFHRYYNRYRVVTDDPALSSSRLYLMLGIRQVLRNGLQLLGVSAPEKM
ncbi:MAG: arginine--tRNA ligase [Desulfobacterota bacterium]|nr:arginine--tRNA ligase [Thermodesulfobacteriota bacterium]